MRGASTAINAIGDGRLAAEEIIRELGVESENSTSSVFLTPDLNELQFRKSIRTKEQTPHESSLKDRANFNLVMETFSTEQATLEASRCLSCDQLCSVCVSVCPNLANFTYQVTPKTYKLFKAVAVEGGNPEIVPDEEFTVEQPYQVMNIRDLCNECANCVTFCPSAGKPYQDKPGISLSMESFNLEEEGYFLSKLQNRTVLIHKHHSRISTLSLDNNLYTYETDQVRAILDTETLALKEVRFLTACVKEYRFSFAAEMSIILKGAMQLPF
ncbi:MAG: hypothetical protein IPH88_00580 [Bacteroidales bacterium]|nr:hypothetical protein [Bacteroidales bacterium]